MAFLKQKPDTKTSGMWHKRAGAAIPGAVRPPGRAPWPLRGAPVYLAQGSGAWLEDVDGNRYVDLVGAGGAMILGHGDPRVSEAIRQTAQQGITAGPASPAVLLAEQLTQRLAPAQKAHFSATQGQAAALAVRLARAATKRRHVIAFTGCYHGASSELLALSGMNAADGATTAALAGDDGVIALPYGDLGLVAAAFAQAQGQIAAVITEAAPSHMGVIAPPIGFNAQLAKTCREQGALLILDETTTGFRASATGILGLQAAKEGWEPDLLILGQVIGGGLPLAALAGTATLMDLLSPLGDVDAPSDGAGPLPCAAGLATLAGCDPALYETLGTVSAALRELMGQEFEAAGVPCHIGHAGTLFSLAFTDAPVRDHASATAQSPGRYAAFTRALLERGVYAPASPFEPWLVSGAHDERAIEHIAAALPHAAKAAAKAPAAG